MKEKVENKLDIFNIVKDRKRNEILECMKRQKKVPLKVKENIEQKIVIEIDDDKSKYYIKQTDLRKEKLKKLRPYILGFVFLVMAGTIGFLFRQYLEFQDYLSKNEELVTLSQKYLAEQKRKTEELKELQSLTLDNIENIPEERKNLMLNIIPSGNPLSRELEVTSNFGNRKHPISGGVKHHNGVDLRLNTGDDVIAPAIGKVIFAGVKGGYGNTVILEHAFGFQTLYAHLDKIYVDTGEIVGKGKVIAAGGNTGNSTGPHLHYEVLYNNAQVEPENFIVWDKENFNIVFNNEKNVQWESFLTIMGKNQTK